VRKIDLNVLTTRSLFHYYRFIETHFE